MQCRVLLLDEATSACDLATDAHIQRTLRVAFNDCTILTIAHRINTIIDSDIVVVIGDGLVLESGPPGELLKQPDSAFSSIIAELGEEAAENMREQAVESAAI